MSFLNTEIAVPLWVLLLIIAGLIPLFFLTLKWLKGKVVVLDKADIVIDTRMTTITPIKKDQPENKKKPKHPNVIKVLKLLAATGEQGILLQSIADRLGINSNEANGALEYLKKKKLIEVVEGMSGEKFFLTQLGKNYCHTKRYS